MHIEGMVALVTGAASGLGAATAAKLAEQGAKVAVLDFDAEGGRATAEKIGGISVALDVTDEAAVSAAIDEIASTLGTPRIAVNCAGIAGAARIVGREGKTSVDLFQRTIAVNLFGSYNVMTHAARHMVAAEPLADGERGVVINTSSIAYQDGQIGQSAYAASKGAISAMCLPAAREFARSGVRVMAIAPGLFHTPMMEGLPDETTAQITANIPFPARLGSPTEYGDLVTHIVTNPYLNGSTIRLDGSVRLPPK